MKPVALAALGSILLAACTSGENEFVEQRLFAMGTSVDVVIVTPDAASARDAIDSVEKMLRQFERDYYAWADGELAALNSALQAGQAFEVSEALGALLADAKRLSALSDGTFDPGVGRLIEAWGFHSTLEPPTRPPAADEIVKLAESSAGIAALEIEGRRIRAGTSGVMLDLGGIAKGYAIDLILDMLARDGITDAMVNAGGDVRVAGRAGERAWRVGVQSPRSDGLLGVVELADGEAVFTSGDYERYYESPEGRKHHLLDPATGEPAAHTQAVTVIARDGVTADAAATALFVAGPDRWLPIARRLGIESALRVDASGRIEATVPMRDRLQISPEAGSDILPVIM